MTVYEDVGRTRVPWGGLLLRLFLVILPAQLLGILISGALVSLTDPTTGTPGYVILIAAGLVAGLAVGLLVPPMPGRLTTYLVTSALFGAVTVSVLLFVSQLSRPAGTPGMTLASAAVGPLVVVPVQALVTWLLWRTRHRP